jgi:hypothetical protein
MEDKMDNVIFGPLIIEYHRHLIDRIKQYLDEDDPVYGEKRGIEDEEENKINLERFQFVKVLLKYKFNLIVPNFEISGNNKNEKFKLELINDILESLEDDDERLYEWYELFFVLKFLEEGHDIIRRALSLRKIIYMEKPSPRLLQYSQEACFTYAQGYHNSSSILLRAVVEQALKEKYSINISGTLGDIRSYLYDKHKIISEDLNDKIKKIIDLGNKAVHNISINREISESHNLHMIKIAQNILKELFK